MANGPFPEGCSELYLVARFPATFDFYSRQIGSQLTVRMCACARFQDMSQSGSAVLPQTPYHGGVCSRPGVHVCVRAMCECVISTGGARGSVSFSMDSFHSQHCALLFTVPESSPVALILSAVFESPLCCCCERLFAFSVDSPLCLFVFDLVFVFYLIFYSLFALRLVRTLPLTLPRFLTFPT